MDERHQDCVRLACFFRQVTQTVRDVDLLTQVCAHRSSDMRPVGTSYSRGHARLLSKGSGIFSATSDISCALITCSAACGFDNHSEAVLLIVHRFDSMPQIVVVLEKTTLLLEEQRLSRLASSRG
jgi:hypothetical protein